MSILQQLYPGDAATWTVAVILVQMTSVVGAILLIARLVERQGAAATHGLWLCALLCVVLCPVLTIGCRQTGLTISSIPLSMELPGLQEPFVTEGDVIERRRTSPATDRRLAEPVPHMTDALSGAEATKFADRGLNASNRSSLTGSEKPDRTQPGYFRTAVSAATLLWGTGVLIMLAGLIGDIRRVRHLTRDSQPLDHGGADTIPAGVQKRVAVSHRVRIAVSPRAVTPLTFGVLRPTVVIPTRLLEKLSDEELEDVLVHECAHIIRRDVAVGLVQRLLAILCWFHPLIHVLNRRLSRAREEVCDNYVLRNGEPGRYARTLLTVAEHVTAARAIPAGVGLLQPHWKLENRIAGLLNRRRKIMVRANRILLAPLFLALAMAGIIIAGIRPVAAAGNEPDRTPAANAAAGADRPDARPAGKKAPREFSFDKLIVKVDSFAAHENLTTTFQKDGSFVVEPHPLSQPHRDRVNPSRYRLSSTVMAQLEYLLKEADYLKEPPIEKIATDDDRGVVELIQRTRAKNPDDPAIRYYEATIRMRRAGLAMGTDGTWFTFTLLRKGEKRVLSRYQEELKRPPVNLLVRFMRRLYAQETFYHQLTSLDPDRNDPLLDLNLRLDHALGRRNLNDPWLMLPLDFGRLADPLQELADSDDPRSAARAQRAIRAIRRLPDGDYGRPLIPVPPAEADRLATFYLFRLNRLGERDEQEHLAIAPDGWFEFWISGPPKDTEYRERVYRHVGKLPREKLERLDELLVATKHFRRTDATYGFSAPRKRGVYEMAVIHEARLRRVLSHTKRRSKEYEDLQDFVTDQIVGLMKRRESK